MSRNAKIILAVIGGLVACCCIVALAFTVLLPRFGAQFAEEFLELEAEAGEVANGIVDYDLPAGMQEDMAINFLGVRTAVFTSEDNQRLIMFMQFPSALAGNEAEMRRQMEDTFREQFGTDDQRLEVVSREEVTINGQPATLTTSESVDMEITVRQVVGVFESKNGSPAMFVAVAPADRWQADGMDRFLESMQRGGGGR
jgi:BMFP domain-containing protein YqiC